MPSTSVEADNAQQLAGKSPESYREPRWDDIQDVPESVETSYTGRAPIEVDAQNDGSGLSRCSEDEVLKRNGNAWACAEDGGESYTAQSPVAIDQVRQR